MTDEEYIRANWQPNSKVPCGPNTVIVLGDPYWIGPRRCEIDAESWATAAHLTRERKRQIDKIKEEIEYMKRKTKIDDAFFAPKRILARLNRDMEILQRGMKPNATPGGTDVEATK